MRLDPTVPQLVLLAFLATFLIARTVVLLIMMRVVPTLYLNMGGTHVHHLNYGIVLLSIVGGWLVLGRPDGIAFHVAAAVYAVGLALTWDEFGMWLHLGGPYWQRASFDAVTVIAATLTLAAFAPDLHRFRPHHWVTAACLAVLLAVFAVVLVKSLRWAGARVSPFLQQVEANDPGRAGARPSR